MSTEEQPTYTAPEPLVYPDGDTRIAFPWGVYVLHSNILSLKSEYLRGLFRWPKSASPGNLDDGVSKWTLVLSKDDFLTIASDENPGPTVVRDQMFEEAASHHCFIRALYGLPLQDTFIVLHDAAKIADRYLALRGFRQSALETLLDRNLTRTMTAIPDAPLEYLDLGHKLSSIQIFKEAFVHCVGRFMQLKTELAFQELSEGVQEALKKEFERLKDLRAQTWMKLWCIDGNHNSAVQLNFHQAVSPNAVSLNLHQAFRWYGLLQQGDGAYDGQYAGFLALALNTLKQPANSPGISLSFSAMGVTISSEFNSATQPLVHGTKWSKVSAKFPYLLCAKVDLTLLDTGE